MVGDEQLGDALAPLELEGRLAVVDEQHLHLAPVIRVDGAGGIQDRDPVFECQPRTRAHLALEAGGNGHAEPRGHQAPLAGFQGPGLAFRKGRP